VATTAVPTASDALRRIRAPRRAPPSGAFLLTVQSEELAPSTESIWALARSPFEDDPRGRMVAVEASRALAP
jgi:hypothetical protein